MGGRQSSQNVSRHDSPTQGSSRFSTASLDNGSMMARSSGSIEFSSDRPVSRRRRRRDRNDQFIEAHSLPSHLFPFVTAEIKCPVCNKRVVTNEIEAHLLACLSKPRVSYNEDVLKADAGECIICFDDMITGEHIARLPCLCIYHKKCLDEWFGRNRCCPAHPDQIPQEYQDTPGASASNMNNTNEASGGNEASATTSPETINTSANESTSEDQTGVFRLDEQQQVGNESSNSPPSNRSIESRNELLAQAAAMNTEELSSQHQEISDITAPTTNHINVQESNPVPIQTLGRQVNNSVELSPPSSSSLHHVNASTSSSSGIPPVEECSSPPIAMSSSAPESRRRKPIVHVDDGSIHGSPNNLDEEEIAQLASKIFVSQQFSPRRFNSNNGSHSGAGSVNSRRDYDGT